VQHPAKNTAHQVNDCCSLCRLQTINLVDIGLTHAKISLNHLNCYSSLFQSPCMRCVVINNQDSSYRTASALLRGKVVHMTPKDILIFQIRTMEQTSAAINRESMLMLKLQIGQRKHIDYLCSTAYCFVEQFQSCCSGSLLPLLQFASISCNNNVLDCSCNLH
jgi:hypothetical protein